MIKGDVVAVVHLHSCVRLFTIPWTTAHQASLSFTFSQSFLNSRYHLTISSSVIPFAFCLWSFPASGSFLVSQLFASGGQSIGASASASVLPMNTQGWYPLGLTGLQSRDSQESSPTPQLKSINSLVLSFLYSPTLTSIHDHWKNHKFD